MSQINLSVWLCLFGAYKEYGGTEVLSIGFSVRATLQWRRYPPFFISLFVAVFHR